MTEQNWQTTAKEHARQLQAAGERLRHLDERLVAAEQVCVIFGWTSLGDDSEMSKAVAQAWHDWAGAYGSTSPTPAWRERVKELARRRDEIRAATLSKIREGSE